MTFPGGKRCAVCLTFDFDAESLWLAREPENAGKLATLSQGRYGAKVGIPKILELLRADGLKGTFFTPGWTVDNHPDKVEAIVRDGHELGHHGYVHYWPDPAQEGQMLDEVDRGLEAMQRRFGVKPVGYRPPGSESTHYLLELLTQRGFLYNSCFKDDIHPYRHVLRDGSPGLIELPEHPSLDDWSYGTSHLRFPRPIFGTDHVLGIWQDEFRVIREWGGVYVLVMHPQVTGRPMRMEILRRFIAFTRQFDDVWYATGQEIAEAFAAQEQS
ncbi:hypothetical protein IP69_08820 [Bosea sp. AAP35]|nr:hypothetical protein IP69_08820 [Bosea sp. AAP35]